MLTSLMLRRLWPKAPSSKINAIVNVCDDVFRQCRMTDPLVVAHFMAQISHENNAGQATRENLSYSAEQIVKVFGVGKHSAGVTIEEAAGLARNPRALAERVYGLGNPKKAKELGNLKTGDAYRYRGNGDLQCTGGANHKRVADLTGFDVYNSPEMLEDPATAFRCAAVEFVALKCVPAAKNDNVAQVTRLVNGGRNGLAERTVWLRKWKTCLDGVDEPPKLPRGAPDPEDKTLAQSKIAQGTVASIGLGAVGTGAQIANAVSTASDTVATARDASDNAVTVIQTVKPFLGLAPSVWAGVAIGCAIGALALGGYVLWKRYRKLVDQGV